MIVDQEKKLDYFMQDDKGIFAGLHMILDLYEVDKLDDLNWIKTGLIGAAKIANANILHTHMHHFGINQGISGVVVLSESHISVHSWPESRYMALDVFMCGKTDPEKAVKFLINYFAAGRYNLSRQRRGDLV